jgi:uncharacterized membrane protein
MTRNLAVSACAEKCGLVPSPTGDYHRAMTEPLLDLVLRPHRSLSPTGFWVIMGIVAVWSFAGGIVFLSVGAWPVLGFLVIDAVLVWIAFKASFGDQRAYERLRLADGTLLIDCVDRRGRAEHFALPAYWLRVSLETAPGQTPCIVLTSHGRRFSIGAFLAPDQQRQVAEHLSETLARARATPLPG